MGTYNRTQEPSGKTHLYLSRKNQMKVGALVTTQQFGQLTVGTVLRMQNSIREFFLVRDALVGTRNEHLPFHKLENIRFEVRYIPEKK
jgi:hypothetical protein